MIADIEELDEREASEIHARRPNAKEVLTPMTGAGIVQNEVRNKKFSKENQTDSLLQPLFKMTIHWMVRKLKMISGLLQEISFIAITCNPESNCTCRKKNRFPIPMKYVDVTRTTHTSLDVLLEKHIDDYLNVDGERELSDAWTGFTRFIFIERKAT